MKVEDKILQENNENMNCQNRIFHVSNMVALRQNLNQIQN